MDRLGKVSFQRLKESDLVIMYKWLNTSFVKEWYGKTGYTYKEILNRYLPRIKGGEPTDGFLIIYEDTPIGYIRTYLLRDYPNYNQYVQADNNVAGIDLFINDNVQGCIVGPEPRNKAAIKTYEKVGFQYIKTIRVPDEEEQEYLMDIKRTEIKFY